MGTGLTEDIALASTSIWIFGILVLFRVIGLMPALLVSTIKAGISLCYFSYFFTEKMLMKDDQVYHEYSVILHDQGWGPLKALTEKEGLAQISIFTGSDHIFYYWWNLLAYELFGVHYYSAVFLNVGVTFLAGVFLSRLICFSGFSDLYRKALVCFFLLHWDLITWSSFFSLKDMLVLTLTTLCLCMIASFQQKFTIKSLLILIASLWLFTMIRFYLPFLILAAAGLWISLEWKSTKKYILIPAIIIVFVLLAPWASKDLVYFELGLPFYPMLRFFLMPQFWTLGPDEGFLFIPSVLHWALFAPLLFGALQLWKQSSTTRLLLIYAGVIVTFYALVPELQGYRHRMQLLFIITWCQFHTLSLLFGPKKRRALH